jgi:hypothetical protein
MIQHHRQFQRIPSSFISTNHFRVRLKHHQSSRPLQKPVICFIYHILFCCLYVSAKRDPCALNQAGETCTKVVKDTIDGRISGVQNYLFYLGQPTEGCRCLGKQQKVDQIGPRRISGCCERRALSGCPGSTT